MCHTNNYQDLDTGALKMLVDQYELLQCGLNGFIFRVACWLLKSSLCTAAQWNIIL